MARLPVLKPRREILYLFDYLLLNFFCAFCAFLRLFADGFHKGLERAAKRSRQTWVRDDFHCIQRSTKQWQGDGCRLDQASGHGGQDQPELSRSIYRARRSLNQRDRLARKFVATDQPIQSIL